MRRELVRRRKHKPSLLRRTRTPVTELPPRVPSHPIPFSAPFSSDPLNGQIAAHFHHHFFLPLAATAIDPDCISGNPTDLDLPNAGLLAIRLEILSHPPAVDDPAVPRPNPAAKEEED